MISPSLHQAPRPSTHPPEVWHPLRWGAAARPPEAQPGGFALEPSVGRGTGGADEPRQGSLTSARASVRPSAVCCWDCGAGEAPTGSD